jgi:hypothetical protein
MKLRIPESNPLYCVELLSLEELSRSSPNSNLRTYYLHGIRSGQIARVNIDPEKSPEAVRYKSSINGLKQELYQSLQGKNYHTGLRVPSSNSYIDCYFDMLKQNDTFSHDLTDDFCKDSGFQAGRSTFTEVQNAIEINSGANRAEINSLLIVDDVINYGNTCATIIHHLQASGMPARIPITVLVLLRIVQ